MAEEHNKKTAECTVETQDRGTFDFSGNKKEDEKPQAQADVIANYVEKVKVEETKADEEHGEDEKKGVMEKIKEKLPGQQKKDEEVVAAPPPPAAVSSESVVAEHHEEESKEKKGIMEKIKEKLPGYHSKTEDEKEKESGAAANH